MHFYNQLLLTKFNCCMKIILSLIALAFVAIAAQAGELTVFDGTDQNQYIPFRATYLDWSPYYGEVIYPAAEITDLVGQDITSVKFYVANETGNVMNGGELSLYLGTTTQDVFPSWSNFDLIREDQLTLVSATAMTPGDSEIVFNFNEPFTYTGDNLVLLVSVTVEGTYSADGYFYGENVSEKCSAYGASATYSQTFFPKTTFTFGNEQQGTVVATLAQANALDDDTEFMFNGDAVVTVCHGGSVYLRDASGYGQITAVEGTFENGQVLSQGWTATKTTNGWVKYANATGLSASGETNAELAVAQKLTGAVDESMLNAYVYVENVTKGLFPVRSLPLPDGTTIALTGNGNQPASGNYNVYGIIWWNNGVVFEPVAWEKYVAPQWELGDVNHDTKVDVDDVAIIIKVILGQNVPVYYATEANMDSDAEGKVDVTDVSLLINKILGK